MHSKFIRKIILFSLKSTCASVPQLIDNKNKDNFKKTSRVLTQLSDRSMWQKAQPKRHFFMIFSCQKLYVFDEHKSLDINVNFIDYYYYLDIDRIITFRSRSERASAIKQIQQHSHRIAACHNHESFGNRGAAFDSMTKLHKRKKNAMEESLSCDIFHHSETWSSCMECATIRIRTPFKHKTL